MNLSSLRGIKNKIQSIKTKEGGGFIVRRPFPTRNLSYIDPFLLVDHLGPINYSPNEAKGAPDHPHRGFITLTYLINGRMQHKDSRGNSGIIENGGVQFMTAGSGVVHSEMPTDDIIEKGGTVEGFQIWINLPISDKMTKPTYQGFTKNEIPEVEEDNGNVKVKVIVGDYSGVSGKVVTKTPITYLHFSLKPGTNLKIPFPRNQSLMTYVFRSSGYFKNLNSNDENNNEFNEKNSVLAKEGDLIVFKDENEEGNGDFIQTSVPSNETQNLEFLLLGGQKLNEPVARYGPFVMTTQEEIYKAFEDYQSGKMGSIDF